MIEDRISKDFRDYDINLLRECIPYYTTVKRLAVWHLSNARFDDAADILNASREKIELHGQDRDFYNLMLFLAEFGKVYQICVDNNNFPEEIKNRFLDLSKAMSEAIHNRQLRKDDRKIIKDDFSDLLLFIYNCI